MTQTHEFSHLLLKPSPAELLDWAFSDLEDLLNDPKITPMHVINVDDFFSAIIGRKMYSSLLKALNSKSTKHKKLRDEYEERIFIFRSKYFDHPS